MNFLMTKKVGDELFEKSNKRFHISLQFLKCEQIKFCKNEFQLRQHCLLSLKRLSNFHRIPKLPSDERKPKKYHIIAMFFERLIRLCSSP